MVFQNEEDEVLMRAMLINKWRQKMLEYKNKANLMLVNDDLDASAVSIVGAR